MENNIRLGKISAVDYAAGTVRVVYHEKDDAVTAPIPLISSEYFMPEVDDMVMVLHLSNGTAMNAAASASAAETAMPVTGGLSINTDSHQVFRDGTPLELTTREYELLTFLASHPNKVYSRIDLMEQVWNYGYVGDDQRTVDVTVRRLREKIETNPANPKYILTRRGVGYYFAV